MFVTTQEDLNSFVSYLEDNCSVEFTVRTDYSGRGMYNRPCIGFDCDSIIAMAMAIGAALESFLGEDLSLPYWPDLFTASDSMGRGYILYFPNWQLEN